jgi:glycine cleavage system T protein
MAEALERTALHDWHVAHGGRMVPFAGWEMPLRYDAGALEEHRVVRRSAGLFDIDHMGQFTITGADAVVFLDHLLTRRSGHLAVGRAQYALLCAGDGGVVDDVFVYRRSGDWFLVVNASNRRKDLAWLKDHAAAFDVAVTDVSDPTCMLALQGPRALPLLQTLVTADLAAVERFSAVTVAVAGVEVYAGRTGYTGEDGFELFFDNTAALTVWEAILAGGRNARIEVLPIGLAARDSLRFEPGFALYGHEIDETITPLEAGLGWACDLDSDFVGRDALVRQKAQGLTKKLVAFELTEPGVPRQGCMVTAPDGNEVGLVVEGLYAPTLDRCCGHAFVPPEWSAAGTALAVVIRDQPKAAVVVRRPLYTPAYRSTTPPRRQP